MTDTPQLPPAYRLVALDEIDSTNDEAKRLIGQGAGDGTLVWARAQLRGRGRRGREWVSPPGNLYCSVILRPECTPAQAAQLSFAAALALADGLSPLVPPHSQITFKWPNDVLFNEKKVAGILLESSTAESGRVDWLVLGLGVNVASSPADTAFPATSLHEEGSGPVAVVEVLENFSRHLLTQINRWRDDGFAPIREKWLRRAAGVGEEVTVVLESETLTGEFVGIDETGALIIGLAGGERRTVTSSDVFFGPRAP